METDAPSAILDLFDADLALLQESFFCWSVDEQARFTFRNHDLADVELQVLADMVHAGACVGSEHGCTVSVNDGATLRVLMNWSEHGLVERMREDAGSTVWQLSPQGASSLSVLRRAHSPQVVSIPREPLPLASATGWELIFRLDNGGWHWAKLPSKRQARLALPPYVAGGERTFFTAGIECNRDYLQALLQAEELFQNGIPHILHWSPQRKYYKDLLQEKMPRLRLQDASSRPQLEADVDLALGGAVGPASVGAQGGGGNGDVHGAGRDEVASSGGAASECDHEAILWTLPIATQGGNLGRIMLLFRGFLSRQPCWKATVVASLPLPPNLFLLRGF